MIVLLFGSVHEFNLFPIELFDTVDLNRSAYRRFAIRAINVLGLDKTGAAVTMVCAAKQHC
jgi:hypothetical protein